MLLNQRSSSFVYLRLMFLSLLTMTGFLCLGMATLAHTTGIDFIATRSQVEFDAVYTSMTVIGLTFLLFVTGVLFMMQERRDGDDDRRHETTPIDFDCRRSGDDCRRSL